MTLLTSDTFNMKKIRVLFLCAALLVLIFCIIPASAAVLEVTVKGTVSAISVANNTLTLSDPQQYGCDYGSGASAPVCSWSPMNTTAISGTIPDVAAFSVFTQNDQVVAESFGEAGGKWIALAKLYGSGPGANYATDEIGDIGSLPTSLVGDYSVNGATVPNCSACAGTICTAALSNVTITSGSMVVAEKSIIPGMSLFFNGRNDASSVNVTFVDGQVSSASCPGYSLMTGVQPISDYLVFVVPPVGMSGTAMSVVSSPEPTTASVPVATTTQQSDMPFIAISVLGLGIALIFAHRRGD
jgi:hypothetical protein